MPTWKSQYFFLERFDGLVFVLPWRHLLINSVEKRISTLSSTEDVFKNAAPAYNDALKKSGHNYTIKYSKQYPKKPRTNGRKRSRRVTWFNPPYSASVKTNVASKFLSLITKHFPVGHKLHKIFNKNTVKVSYSCCKNMNAVIKSHNQKIIRNSKRSASPQKTCNCRVKKDCPLTGECLVKSVVYKATISHNNTESVYFGLAGGTFKERYRNHTKSFRHERYEKETELSKYVWSLKRRNIEYNLHWDIVKKCNTIMRKSGICNLCLEEKLAILCNKQNSINRRSELISKCRHGNTKTRPSNRSKKKY